MEYDNQDEYRIKNLHATPEEIDDRQMLELSVLLHKWESGDLPVEDVLFGVADTVGATIIIRFDYQYFRQCETEEGAKQFVLDEYRSASMQGMSATLKNYSPEEIERATKEAQNKYALAVAELRKLLRPEVLGEDSQTVIKENIKSLLALMEQPDFTSWQIAKAIAQVILQPSEDDVDVGDEEDEWGDDFQKNSPLNDFFRSVDRSENRFGLKKKDNRSTLDELKPKTEAEVKRPLAYQFAYQRAYQAWAKEKRGQGADKYDTDLRSFGWDDKAAKPDRSDNLELIIPIDFPNRTLCKGIEIAPTGTALVQLLDKNEAHNWDPTNVARITTYSVDFIPSSPEDVAALRNVLSQAFKLLGDIPHKYKYCDFTTSGPGYRRMPPSDCYSVVDGVERINWHRIERDAADTYISENDGKLTPSARFDLDDLWLLYYLVEPIVEPNEKIATAMNGARYAEERGAILSPKPHYERQSYYDDEEDEPQHEVNDQSGFLKKSNPNDVLADGMRDAFTDLALNKIDQAGFLARVVTLAEHTLSGSIQDSFDHFPSYGKLLTERRSQGMEITYADAAQQRVQDLLRYLLSEPEDSGRPLSIALMAALNEVSKPLQAAERDKERQSTRDYYSKSNAWRAGSRESSDEALARIMKMFGGEDSDKLNHMSDAVRGTPVRTQVEIEESRKQGLTVASQLIIADSAVETAIDGVHAAHINPEYVHYMTGEWVDRYKSYHGTYNTRTKGSPLVRYELPEALKPFCPEGSQRPSFTLLFDASAIGPV